MNKLLSALLAAVLVSSTVSAQAMSLPPVKGDKCFVEAQMARMAMKIRQSDMELPEALANAKEEKMKLMLIDAYKNEPLVPKNKVDYVSSMFGKKYLMECTKAKNEAQ